MARFTPSPHWSGEEYMSRLTRALFTCLRVKEGTMSKWQLIITRLLAIALLVGPACAQQSQELGDRPQPSVRFQGQVSFHMPNGTIKQVSVTVRNWSVVGARTPARFPEQGFLLVQL